MELVDMRDLGSRAAMRVGSSPFRRTKKKDMTVGHVFLFGFRSRCRSTLRYCKCSGQVNCPSAKVFAAGENACTAQSAAGQKAGLSPLCIAFHLNCNRTRCRWASIWFWVQNWGLALILLRDSKKSCCKIRFSGQKEKFIYEKSEREPPLRRFSLTLSLVLFL